MKQKKTLRFWGYRRTKKEVREKMYWGDLSKYRSQIYALSILWIVIFHILETFSDKFQFNWLFAIVFNNGNIGVDIFLFLSGISMYYSMKDMKI